MLIGQTLACKASLTQYLRHLAWTLICPRDIRYPVH